MGRAVLLPHTSTGYRVVDRPSDKWAGCIAAADQTDRCLAIGVLAPKARPNADYCGCWSKGITSVKCATAATNRPLYGGEKKSDPDLHGQITRQTINDDDDDDDDDDVPN